NLDPGQGGVTPQSPVNASHPRHPSRPTSIASLRTKRSGGGMDVALCTEVSVERHKPLICTGHGCGGGRRKGAGVAIAGAVHSGGAGHAGVEVRAGWSGLGGQPDAQLGCAHSENVSSIGWYAVEMGAYIPPGWPAGVHPPGSEDFESTAVGWL